MVVFVERRRRWNKGSGFVVVLCGRCARVSGLGVVKDNTAKNKRHSDFLLLIQTASYGATNKHRMASEVSTEQLENVGRRETNGGVM